jgi:hypothetical protein
VTTASTQTASEMSAIPDTTWRRLLTQRKGSSRLSAKVLPYRIGISGRPDGTWSDYVRLEPMYDLPGFLRERCPQDVSKRTLDLYRRAHHCGGFYGLVVDRIADGQVRETPSLREERTWLRAAWETHLTHACGARATARHAIEESMIELKAAVELERSFIEEGALDADVYAVAVRSKVAFLWVTTGVMLRTHGADEGEVTRAREVFERIMIALQCNDDACDESEDRALRGVSIPEALGVDGSALHAVGAMMLDRLRTEESESRVGAWCEGVARRSWGMIPYAERTLATIGAMALIDGMSERRMLS